MTLATDPDWLTRALYAGVDAVLLLIFADLPYVGGLLCFTFSGGQWVWRYSSWPDGLLSIRHLLGLRAV